MKPLPATVESLIAELDVLYPLRAPQLDETDRQIFFKAGQRELVDKLKARLQYTKELA